MNRDEHGLANTLVSAPPTHNGFNFAKRFTLRLNGKSKAWRNKIITASKKLYMYFTDRTPLGRREYARAVASRGSPRPWWRRCRGAPAGVAGGSRQQSRTFTCKIRGERYLHCSNPGVKGTCLFSFDFNDKKKIFNDRMKTCWDCLCRIPRP